MIHRVKVSESISECMRVMDTLVAGRQAGRWIDRETDQLLKDRVNIVSDGE